MACDAETMLGDAKCLVSLADHQLLAYIAYQMAVNAGEAPTKENIAALGNCLASALWDQQLRAAIALFACQSVPT